MYAAVPTTQPVKAGRGKLVALVVIIIIVAAAVGGYYALYGMGPSRKSAVSIPNGTGSSQSLNFSPSTITVVLGKNNTIVFTNSDVALHTVTFTSAPPGVSLASISDNNLPAGSTFTVVLKAAGTYQYHCTIHTWMTGTVIVKSS